MLDATSSHLLLPEYQQASFDPSTAASGDLEPDGMTLIAETMARVGYAPPTTDPARPSAGISGCRTSGIGSGLPDFGAVGPPVVEVAVFVTCDGDAGATLEPVAPGATRVAVGGVI